MISPSKIALGANIPCQSGTDHEGVCSCKWTGTPVLFLQMDLDPSSVLPDALRVSVVTGG